MHFFKKRDWSGQKVLFVLEKIVLHLLVMTHYFQLLLFRKEHDYALSLPFMMLNSCLIQTKFERYHEDLLFKFVVSFRYSTSDTSIRKQQKMVFPWVYFASAECFIRIL